MRQYDSIKTIETDQNISKSQIKVSAQDLDNNS